MSKLITLNFSHFDSPYPESSTVFNQPRIVTQLVPYRIKRIGKEEGQTRRLTRDEKAAKNLNIPYTVNFIINCSMEEFADILSNNSLDSAQTALCRDIRRRGKNKVDYEVLAMALLYPLPHVSDCCSKLQEKKD